MPFKSRKQQQWYNATGQTFYDDKPSSHRKVEGEEESDLTTASGGDIDIQDKNLETPMGSSRETLSFEGKTFAISPEGHVPKDDDLEFEDKIYTEVTEEEKEMKRGQENSKWDDDCPEGYYFDDKIDFKCKEEAHEENPNHDSDTGQFTSGSGSGGGKSKYPEKPDHLTDKEYEKQKKEYEKSQKKVDPKKAEKYHKKRWEGMSPSERSLFLVSKGKRITEDEYNDKGFQKLLKSDWKNVPQTFKSIFGSQIGDESKAQEEGLASVSGPPAGTEPTVMVKDEENLTAEDDLTSEDLTSEPIGETLIDQFGIKYIEAKEGHIIKKSDLIFENKVWTQEGLGNCVFCQGTGKVTVENIGLKDCPDCDGTGDVQAPNPQIVPDVMGQMQNPENPNVTDPNETGMDPNKPTGQDQIPQQPSQDPNEPQVEKPTPQPEDEKKNKPNFGESKVKACEKSMKQYRGYIKKELEVLKKKAKSNEAVSVMYGLPTLQKEGKKIKGKLAYAGVSLNDRIYLPEELAKGHGRTLPLLLNHSSVVGAEEELDRLDDEMREALENEKDYQIGEVTLTWDPEQLTLFYEGVIDHEFFQKEVDDADMAVSLGIYYDSDSPTVCDESCYTLIKGAEFREVSLVYHPGFPIATIEAVEAEIKAKSMKAKEDIHHGSSNLFDNKEMMDKFKNGSKKADEDSLIKVDEEPEGTKATVLDEWDKKEEAKEDEEEIIVTDKPEIISQATQVPSEYWNEIATNEMATENNFSIQGVNGFTISNSNGVTRYTLDPNSQYQTNWLHLNVNEGGAKIYGENFQLQPKMTTSPELTKEIENHPPIEITDSDGDAFKKKIKDN